MIVKHLILRWKVMAVVGVAVAVVGVGKGCKNLK